MVEGRDTGIIRPQIPWVKYGSDMGVGQTGVCGGGCCGCLGLQTKPRDLVFVSALSLMVVSVPISVRTCQSP